MSTLMSKIMENMKKFSFSSNIYWLWLLGEYWKLWHRKGWRYQRCNQKS